MTIILETSHCICSLQCARAGAALLPDTLTGRSLDEIVRVLHSEGDRLQPGRNLSPEC